MLNNPKNGLILGLPLRDGCFSSMISLVLSIPRLTYVLRGFTHDFIMLSSDESSSTAWTTAPGFWSSNMKKGDNNV